jgi:hypothetical protein
VATAGLPIALCVILASTGAACGTHTTSSKARLASTCRKPYNSLSPSESIDCVAAGYYRAEIKKAQRAYHRAIQPRRLVLTNDQQTVTINAHEGVAVFDAPNLEDQTIRPGTCARSGRGRGYHLGYDDKLPFTFSRLRRATFAVERHAGDGSVAACVDHRGIADLTTNVSHAEVRLRARRQGTALVYRSRDMKVRLTSAAGGTKTLLVAYTGAPGQGDQRAHLRRGTCEGIPNGREWDIYLPNDHTETEHSYRKVAIPIPFSQIVGGRWVYEEHGGVEGDQVYTCVQF